MAAPTAELTVTAEAKGVRGPAFARMRDRPLTGTRYRGDTSVVFIPVGSTVCVFWGALIEAAGTRTVVDGFVATAGRTGLRAW